MIQTFFQKIKKLPIIAKGIAIIIIAIAIWQGFSFFSGEKTATATYQTITVVKGNLMVSVTGSGQVSTANNGTITTQASGVVSKVYVKDGDQVKTGDKIAELDLDIPGQQSAAQASSAYQSAKNNLESSKAAMYTTQSDMFAQWDKFYNTAINSTYQNSDGSPNTSTRTLPAYMELNNTWLAAESKYKTQQNVVYQSQTAVNAAWYGYQQTSPTIIAPISGTVSGLSLQAGSVITQSTSTSNSSQSSTKIATIKTKAMPTVSVNLTELDVPRIIIGDLAIVKFDAFFNKSFTGKVVSIDTSGAVSSGVTIYPTVIRLDTDSTAFLPSMAATATIIIDTKAGILTVPTTSIQKLNGSSYVRVLKNGKAQPVAVETGAYSSTATEITSGLSEGDVVITSAVATPGTTRTGSTSIFSSFGRGGGFGGGGR